MVFLLPGGGRLGANFFYSKLKDAMVRRDSTFGGAAFIIYDGELSRVQKIVNAENATVSGVESSIEVPLTGWLSARGAVNFMWGETDEENRCGMSHSIWLRKSACFKR
jgi:outer membrane receptor for ferrienterochelin and colicin